MTFFKHNICFILLGLIVLYFVLVISNSVHEGIGRIITQEKINDTYIVHK